MARKAFGCHKVERKLEVQSGENKSTDSIGPCYAMVLYKHSNMVTVKTSWAVSKYLLLAVLKQQNDKNETKKNMRTRL
jgi:hypothetical protein